MSNQEANHYNTFVPMKHHVFFWIHKKLNYGEALFIKANIPELGSNQDSHAIRLINLHGIYWVGSILIDPYQRAEDLVKYEYFIASFDDPIYKNHDQKIIQREFRLSELQEHYIKIYDEWDITGDFPGRKQIFNPKDMLFLNFSIPKSLAYGEGLFGLGPVELLGEEDPLKSKRMIWTHNNIWRITFDIPFSQAIFLGGKMTFLFFKSYFYKRQNVYWELVGKSNQTVRTFDTQEALNLWREQNPDIPVFFDFDQEEGNFEQEFDPTRPPVLLKFVYEHPYNEEIDRVLDVHVVSRAFDKVKMNKGQNRKWTAEVWVKAEHITDGRLAYDFHFEVHKIDHTVELTKPHISDEQVRPGMIVENCFREDRLVTCSKSEIPVLPPRIHETTQLERLNQNFQSFLSSSRSPWTHTASAPALTPTLTSTSTLNSFSSDPEPSFTTTTSSTSQENNYNNYSSTSREIIQKHCSIVRDLQKGHEELISVASAANQLITNCQHLINSIQSRNFPTSVKGYLRIGVLKPEIEKARYLLKRISELGFVQDDCKKVIEKLTENLQIKKSLADLDHMNKVQNGLKDHLGEDTFKLLRVELLTLVKKWGKQNFSEDIQRQIIEKIAQYFPLYSFDPKDLILCCLLVNQYCHDKNQGAYTTKVEHGTCQVRMQTQLQNHFQKYLPEMSDTSKTARILNHPFYKLIFKLVTEDLDYFVNYGNQYGLGLRWISEYEHPLFKMLINYSLLYSVAKNFDQTIQEFTTCRCAELGPFCYESNSTTITYANLSSLEQKYLAEKAHLQVKTKDMNEQIVEQETKLVQLCQETLEREVQDLIQIQLDLQLLQKKREEGIDGVCLDIVIEELEESVGALDQELERIDQIGNFEEKIASVRDLKNHRNLQAIERFYNSMINNNNNA